MKFKIQQYRIYLYTEEIETETRVDAIIKSMTKDEKGLDWFMKQSESYGLGEFEFVGYQRDGMGLGGFYEDEVDELCEAGLIDWQDGEQVISSIKSVKEIK